MQNEIGGELETAEAHCGAVLLPGACRQSGSAVLKTWSTCAVMAEGGRARASGGYDQVGIGA